MATTLEFFLKLGPNEKFVNDIVKNSEQKITKKGIIYFILKEQENED